MKILRASPKIKVSKKDLQYKKPNFWYLTLGSITINYCIIAAWRGSLWHCWSITEAQAFIAAFSSFFIFLCRVAFLVFLFLLFLKIAFFFLFFFSILPLLDSEDGQESGARERGKTCGIGLWIGPKSGLLLSDICYVNACSPSELKRHSSFSSKRFSWGVQVRQVDQPIEHNNNIVSKPFSSSFGTVSRC